MNSKYIKIPKTIKIYSNRVLAALTVHERASVHMVFRYIRLRSSIVAGR